MAPKSPFGGAARSRPDGVVAGRVWDRGGCLLPDARRPVHAEAKFRAELDMKFGRNFYDGISIWIANSELVRMSGFEPPRYCYHKLLRLSKMVETRAFIVACANSVVLNFLLFRFFRLF